VHHWTPAQVDDMTLQEIWRAYNATLRFEKAKADEIRKATKGGGR